MGDTLLSVNRRIKKLEEDTKLNSHYQKLKKTKCIAQLKI